MTLALPPDPPPLVALLTFHKGIRAALAVFDTTSALASAGLFDVVHASALHEFFVGPLRWHDEDETRSLLPRLLKKDRARALAPITACAQEHTRMDRTLDAVLDHLRDLADGSGDPDADLLFTTNAALHDVLVPHLRREEEEIFPLARELLDDNDWRDIGVEMHVRRLGRVAGIALPSRQMSGTQAG